MNRLLTCTALGLVLGLTPALAQDPPADDPANPPALEQPAQPEAAPSAPSSEPSDPAAPVPGDTSQMSPESDATLPQSSEAPPSEPASPSAEAPQSEPSSPPTAEAPQSIEPAAPKSAEAQGGAQFLTKQESSDYLASNLIGKSVYNSQDEVIGDINDLVSDNSGKFVAVLIGAGGFLGIGEKDVAIRFEDLSLTRDEDNDIKVVANLSKDMLASAPDYETLSEQSVAVGSSERSDQSDQKGASDTY